jgi:hypothetical protein
MHEVRRTLERVAHASQSTWRVSMAVTRKGVVRDLTELIAALDRRTPQVLRAGEVSIARDAAALKVRALKRIEDLEREQPAGSILRRAHAADHR